MDVIKFLNPTLPTKFEQAEIVNGIKTKMWIERYREEGAFTFTGPVSSGLREMLPIGTFISHIDTAEVMVVENHEINDNQGKESDIVVTGRGYETILDHRVAGNNKDYAAASAANQMMIHGGYSATPDYTWNQAVHMVNDHIYAPFLAAYDVGNSIPNLAIYSAVSSIAGAVSEQRIVDMAPLHKALKKLLEIDDLGIKVVRPSVGIIDLALLVHTGTDRSATVTFEYDVGEVIQADYFWSGLPFNAAVVYGKYLELFVVGSSTDYNRRVMMVDASDLDNSYSTVPPATDIPPIKAAMQQRGLSAIAMQKSVAITKAEISKQATKQVYRKDYNLGDLVTVNGDYNETSIMRVSEYVEIEDDTGKSSYPTLVMV